MSFHNLSQYARRGYGNPFPTLVNVDSLNVALASRLLQESRSRRRYATASPSLCTASADVTTAGDANDPTHAARPTSSRKAQMAEGSGSLAKRPVRTTATPTASLNRMSRSVQKGKRRIQPAPHLGRLDPSLPLAFLDRREGTGSVGDSPGETASGRERMRDVARRASRLETALEAGSADRVWDTLSDLANFDASNASGRPSPLSSHTSAVDVLSAKDYQRALRILISRGSRTKTDAARITRVVSQIRRQSRRLSAKIQAATDQGQWERVRLYSRQLEDWNAILTPALLNRAIAYSGHGLRTATMNEFEEVLDQLLEIGDFGASASKQEPDLTAKRQPTSSRAARYQTESIHRSVQSGLRSHDRAAFPDVVTYNTVLSILVRMLHRRTPQYRPTDVEGPDEDDTLDARAAELQQARVRARDANLSDKLRRLQLDDGPSGGVVSLEWADKVFHSVLQRMQHQSKIEPDSVTFNTMLSMYCRLDQWETVHQAVRAMHDRNILRTECINNVLWFWIRRGSSNKVKDTAAVTTAAMDDALEIYRRLRDNVVQLELGKRYSDVDADERSQYDAPHRSWKFVRADEDDGEVHDPSTGSGSAIKPKGKSSQHESTSSTMPAGTVTDMRDDALGRVLGISDLPMDLVPSDVTYSLIIKSLAHEGRFADALGVFKDLVSTPKGSAITDRLDGIVQHDAMMQPNLGIFDSFFRGYSRFGRPSELVHYDEQDPTNSTWQRLEFDEAPNEGESDIETDAKAHAIAEELEDEHGEQKALWTMSTFKEIFVAFLRFQPDESEIWRAAGTSSDPAQRKSGQVRVPQNRDLAEEALAGSHTAASSREAYGASGSPISSSAIRGGRTLSEKRQLPLTYSDLNIRQRRLLNELRRSPSAKQLFWILTAIRRVSGDEPNWSLAMWYQVVDKFASSHSSPHATSTGIAHTRSFAWTDFRLDNRLERIVEYLEKKRQVDHSADA
ncbi:hypothetical protein BCV70DRAFT_198119 [Testicularia cyperi]|uniref:Uncharacterized protein n=1 Tax=Testicularia cyperi TaxID=1882483 RepID=A0A317XVA6_9BASI|nr:hypothetical protein BCV70DRAFT_198119 [Testicularia cyperi]